MPGECRTRLPANGSGWAVRSPPALTRRHPRRSARNRGRRTPGRTEYRADPVRLAPRRRRLNSDARHAVRRCRRRVAAHRWRHAGLRWPALLNRHPAVTPRGSRQHPVMPAMSRHRGWSARLGAAPVRRRCRGPQRPRPVRCGRPPRPSRSRPPPAAPPQHGSGDRQARVVRPGRPRPATRGAPVPPVNAPAVPAVDAPTRCGHRAPRTAVPGSTTTGDVSTLAVVRPPGGLAEPEPRSRPWRPRCARRRPGEAIRGGVPDRGACPPGPPMARPGCPRSAQRHESAAGAVRVRRRPDTRPPTRLAPPRRTAPCDAGYAPSTWRRIPVPRAGRIRLRSSTESPVSWV